MALQVPQYLSTRSPEYLYNVMRATYLRASENSDGKYTVTCSERPYDMQVCHGPERDGIRSGTFHSTNLVCQWLGVGCSSGHFYSKMFLKGQSVYELRVGLFTLGRLGGSYAVAALNAGDTAFIGQCVDTWGNVVGDHTILGAALMNACVPVVEPFTRTIHTPANSFINNNTHAEVIISATRIESGMRSYCRNVMVPQPPERPLIIPRLANWWTTLAGRILPTDEMASID